MPVWELFSTGLEDRHRQVQTKKSDRQADKHKLAELQLLPVETLVAVLKHKSTQV